MKTAALPLAAALAVLPVIAAQAQELTLRVTHVLSTTEPMHLASERFAELVEERSAGRIAVEVFPAGQLGSNIDMYEQVRMGAPIVQISDPGYLSDYVPDFGILNGPYLLNEPADFQKLLDSDWYAGISDQIAADHDIRVLTLNWLFGGRQIITNKEIRTPADLQNVSIRVPPNVMWIETFAALGARGETLAWPEVYSGLASGVVDAAEAPLSSLWGSKLYESAKTVSMTNHFIAFSGPILNEDVYQALDPELQQVLTSSAVDAGKYMADLVTESQTTLRTDLEGAGVTFVDDVDTDAFRAATEVVYTKFPKWTPGLHETVRAILDN
ncbi:C4-dicarboxylate TRAP transporter substrate-binding protein [Paracoccus lutimaris]|uniref:Tripartite ATP-independent transporter DctP family solute receptor n=1 Tax=Paracoccus lutimaris TaxID=1490030 RepID=A0A368Z3N5_9RHOB|nr:C4-dicarboxylate TRAP transporter substrate-binding protein [Paracoccus lutimaris]RCW87031.1 tripartite ATP-independent transporter DctP family solute receptor [Paracoccus lutimaris]